MNDLEKISRLELALRTERDELRKTPGPEYIRAANAINTYLQHADTDSKLRFANILLGEPANQFEADNIRPLKTRSLEIR